MCIPNNISNIIDILFVLGENNFNEFENVVNKIQMLYNSDLAYL